jgi:hypothetical protein
VHPSRSNFNPAAALSSAFPAFLNLPASPEKWHIRTWFFAFFGQSIGLDNGRPKEREQATPPDFKYLCDALQKTS